MGYFCKIGNISEKLTRGTLVISPQIFLLYRNICNSSQVRIANVIFDVIPTKDIEQLVTHSLQRNAIQDNTM